MMYRSPYTILHNSNVMSRMLASKLREKGYTVYLQYPGSTERQLFPK
jgi:esterase/lipase